MEQLQEEKGDDENVMIKGSKKNGCFQKHLKNKREKGSDYYGSL